MNKNELLKLVQRAQDKQLTTDEKLKLLKEINSSVREFTSLVKELVGVIKTEQAGSGKD